MRIGPLRLALPTALALPMLALAQAPADRPPLVVPAGVELVQVDAVVTDKKGRYVTDLRAEDFAVVEDGKARAISNFRYVAIAPQPPGREEAASTGPGIGSPVVADAGPRALAIVIDDLSLTREAEPAAREALMRLVDAQLAPGDVAAIVRTAGDMGDLGRFTTDKARLQSAIARVFDDAGEGWIADRGAADVGGGDISGGNGGGADPAGAAIAAMQERLDELTSNMERDRAISQALAVLRVLEGVVQALAWMPGRKSLVLVSEGFALKGSRGDDAMVPRRSREVTEAANRAAVVIYSLDPGGLRTLRATAAWRQERVEEVAPVKDFIPNEAARGRERHASIVNLAEETGGLAFIDTNDFDGAVGQVFADLRGYYLMGFEPALGDAARRGMHEVEVKLKRKGLRVRSRRTFYARGAPGAP